VNRGDRPKIVCFNRATVDLGVDFGKLIAAMQKYVDDFIVPVWGTAAKLTKGSFFVKGAWAMVFLDNADQRGAEAYHDLTPDGMPLAKVFVKTTLKNGDQVSVSASHELVEMLVDPTTNLMTSGPKRKLMYAYESADPVEDLSFAVDGIPMSDFVYPSYFESFRKPKSARFDAMNKVTRPFQILPGGYQTVFKSGKWTQLTGSRAKAKAFAKEDRRGHRSEQRKQAKRKRADVVAIRRSQRQGRG
jgi:hypothetical protein